MGLMDKTKNFHWFAGTEGESTFHIPYVSVEALEKSNATVPPFLKRLSETGDDRSYVVLATLFVESLLDELLSIIIADYRHLSENRDFSLSLKIGLLRAMKVVPPIIPRTIDVIRLVRNEFAHNFELDELNGASIKPMNKLRSAYNGIYAPYLQTSDGKPEREIFEGVLHGAVVAIMSYRPNLIAMRRAIELPEFEASLRARAEAEFHEILSIGRQSK